MKALSIGGAMVDTIALVDDELIERISLSNAGRTFLLLEQGSKTEASSIATHCGGGALNASIGLKRLGFDVSVLCKVGKDDRAGLIRERLQQEGVATSRICVSDTAPTGASAIISAHDRNAAVFTFRGANTGLAAADVEAGLAGAFDLVYVSTLSGASAELLPEIVRLARVHGPFIAVNPGIRQISTRFKRIHAILPQVDLIAVNRSEAEALVRQAVAELAGSENQILRRMAAASLSLVDGSIAVPRGEQIRALIQGIRQLGARNVLVTDGRNGAYAGGEDEIVYCPAYESDRVASTIGAGDASVSTLSGYLKQGNSLADALMAAAVNAASVVSFADAQSGLLAKAELERRLATARSKLKIERWPSL